MSDVVISGASGLIGSAVADTLRDRGDRPIALVRPSSTAAADALRWDPLAGAIDAAGLEGVDAVIHLAGEPLLGRWTERKRRAIRDSRILGTRLLAETIARLQRPPRVLLSGSAVGWYGSRADEVLTEASPPGAGFLATVCDEWERATEPAERAGVRVVTLRTGLVQSAEADLLRLQLPAFKLGLGGKLGSGQQWFPWIALHDHVGATLHLMGRDDARGAVNLTAPNPVRNAEFARTLARVVRRPMFLTVPRPAVAAVFGRAAATELAAASQRVLPARLTDEFGYAFRYRDLEPALRAALRGTRTGSAPSNP